jgi:peptidoglycan/xylan/chitin deacetylase (PgdA/CDA1 family)
VRSLEWTLSLLERIDRGSSGLLTILTYHRIDTPHARPHLDPALISATPPEFERQMAWLAAHTCPLTLADLLEIRRGLARPPPRAVLVTFDDAYRDFAEHAWPALRAHGVPATLFVPTSYPGSQGAGFWWDRLHAALWRTGRREPIATAAGRLALATPEDRSRAHRALSGWAVRTPHDEAMAEVDHVVAVLGEAAFDCPVSSWESLRAMARDGLALAPHARTHARLDRLPLQRAREEIAGSRDDLAREAGHCPPVFAFPGGGHDVRLRALLAAEGFELAFTTRRGPNHLSHAEWLGLRRTNVGRASSLPVIRAELLSWPGRLTAVTARASP